MRRLGLIGICLACLVHPVFPEGDTGSAPSPGPSAEVLIVYHSTQGHTELLAQAVTSGVLEVESVRAHLCAVENVTTSQVVSADAIILGSPVHNANVSLKMQEFINSWPTGGQMANKLGAAFTTGGGISAGEELVQLQILHSMLIYGMIIVGGPDWTQPFGASGVTNEGPFAGSRQLKLTYLDPIFMRKGRALGTRVARLAARMKAAALTQNIQPSSSVQSRQ